MQGSNKPLTIHVNPMFKENPKNIIHINPNKQINMVIHVNPRMVNPFTCGGVQQRNPPQKIINDTLLNNVKQKETPPNIQKSVYVNPKLMQKLKSKVPALKNETKEEKTKIQPKIECSRFVINKTTAKPGNFSVKKTLSPNLISLSKRKLVRIRAETEPKVIAKDLTKGSSSISTPKTLRKVEIKKIASKNQLKKINDTSRLKRISGNQLKKVNAPSLKKINVSSLKKINVSPKSSVPNAKTSANKYKIDRTAGDENTQTQLATKTRGVNNKNLVKIDGVFYRSSKSKLVKSSNHTNSAPKTSSAIKKCSPSTTRIRKVRKHVVINGKIAKIDTSILSKASLPNSNQKSNYKQVISNRVKQRSLQILRHKMCKNNQPCLLFQRFGYCAKYIEGTCPKVHDKKQVALCKNFLQGKCHLDNCPLSHEVGPEKMPTCKYFLEGCCTRDNCQYLHVKVSANTPICVPFLRGYCAKGDQCKERHTNICPEFDKYGKCAKGKNCPYPHKTCLLPQQNTLRLPKSLKSYKKQIVEKRKTVDISSQDETKKRYYDEDCTSQNLEIKKCNIEKKIKIMTMVHSAPLSETEAPVITDKAEMKSQPISDNNRPRRPPIGPLPSYIPIN